jgi:hypothetical protein
MDTCHPANGRPFGSGKPLLDPWNRIGTAWALLAIAVKEEGSSPMLGGPLASSIHGIPRATLDVDIVVDLRWLTPRALATKTARRLSIFMTQLRSLNGCGNIVVFFEGVPELVAVRPRPKKARARRPRIRV